VIAIGIEFLEHNLGIGFRHALYHAKLLEHIIHLADGVHVYEGLNIEIATRLQDPLYALDPKDSPCN
jgi:hypothetical protein